MPREYSHSRYGDSHASGHSRNMYGNHLGPSYTNQTFNFYGSAFNDAQAPPTSAQQMLRSNSETSTRPSIEPAQVATYRYTGLWSDSVRIAHVRKGGAGNVQIALEEMKVMKLGKSIRYTALTFPKGSLEAMNIAIQVHALQDTGQHARPQWNGDSLGTILVPTYLYEVLDQLSSTLPTSEESHLSLWVEEVCIDPTSSYEQQKYLSKMSAIFRAAEAVEIWLGPANRELDQTLEFLPRCSVLEEAKHTSRADVLNQWNLLVSFLQLPVFNDRWLIPKLAFAQRIELRSGIRTVTWLDFCDAVEALRSQIASLHEAAQIAPDLPHLDAESGDLESLAAVSIVCGVEKVLRRTSTPQGDVSALLQTFENVGLGHQNLPHEDSRNALRPLIASIRKPNSKRIDIDSGHGYNECIEYVVQSVGLQGDVDIFCRPWVFPPVSRLIADNGEPFGYPSWMQSIENAPYGTPNGKLRQRINGDSFVGLSVTSKYNAAQGQRAPVWFGNGPPGLPMERAASDSRRGPVQVIKPTGFAFKDLKIRDRGITYAILEGWRIGTVLWATDPVTDGVIPRRAIDKLWNSPGNNNFSDKLWRTLVADRDDTGNPAPSWYRNACRQCMEKRSANGHLNTKHLLFKRQSESAQQYLKRVQSITWNRCFFEVQAQDEALWLGLGPSELKVHDSIGILKGCTVPVALRHDSDPGFPFKCTLVGETYIHGLMNGEAVEGPIGLDWTPNTLSSPCKFLIY